MESLLPSLLVIPIYVTLCNDWRRGGLFDTFSGEALAELPNLLRIEVSADADHPAP